MVTAFLSLLLSTTPTLNEIAWLLIVGVLLDCFVTTKLIIPATMTIIGRGNFWPRRFPPVRSLPLHTFSLLISCTKFTFQGVCELFSIILNLKIFRLYSITSKGPIPLSYLLLITYWITTLTSSQVRFHDDNSNSGAMGGSSMGRGSGGESKDWPVAKASRDSGDYQMDDASALTA